VKHLCGFRVNPDLTQTAGQENVIEGKSVKPSHREILADSHIPAVAITVLLFWSVESGLKALLRPFLRAVDFFPTAVAIRGVPYSGPNGIQDRILLTTTFVYLFDAVVSLFAAWLLSRWVYGVGPLRCLSKYRTRLARGDHV
jgi:hypothetical protein